MEHDPNIQAVELKPVWLVGSAPKGAVGAGQAAEFYLESLQHAGCQPYGLPGGETSALRHNWRQEFMENIENHPALRLAKKADWSINQPPAYDMVNPDALTAESLRPFMGYADEAGREYPVVAEARRRFGFNAETMPYQIGIASHLAGAITLARVFFNKPIPRYGKEFQEATAQEIAAIQRLTGGDVLFELELPPEVLILHKAPALLRPLVAKKLARGLAQTVELADQRCLDAGLALPRIALHECTGDFNKDEHKTLIRPKNLALLVRLANAISAAWPQNRPAPEVVHIPVAFGEHPAPVEAAFYAALGKLSLPENTRLALGIVHELTDSETLKKIMAIAKRALPPAMQNFMLATACGDGRRTKETVAQNIRTMGAALATGQEGNST